MTGIPRTFDMNTEMVENCDNNIRVQQPSLSPESKDQDK